MKYAVGIEIGGTKLQAGVGFDQHENLLGVARQQVEAEKGAQGILTALPSLVDRAVKQSGIPWNSIQAIGVGFGGPVDSKNGITLLSHQIQGWDQFHLQSWCEEQWGKPAVIQNDASTAGFAEALMGAGQGFQRVFYITIGSGIGGGWVVNGLLDEGQGLGAAEIGHTWVPEPDTGEPVLLEAVCSGWAIGTRAIEGLEIEEEPSLLYEQFQGDLSRITAEDVYKAAQKDDLFANTILDETTTTLAIGICNVIALLNPERIVLGGGVSKMGVLFWEPLKRKIGHNAFKPFNSSYDLVAASLGDDVVMHGAVLLAQKY